MLTYRVGSAGDLASAKDMVDYLSEETMPKEMLDMATYYQRGMEPNEQGQTTAEPRRDMRPEVAAVFGIDQNQALNNDEIARVLSGRRIDGSNIPGRAKRRITENKGRNGYIDLCFSADKSVSVAWAFAKTESERAIIMQAHRDAVDSAMRYIEKEIAWAHKGDGGRFGADRGHLGWIKFDHYTSRPTLALKDDGNGNKSLVLAKDDDPAPGGTMMVTMNVPGDMNIHTHVAVPNMVLTEEGRVGSIDFNRLDGRIKEFGSVYQAFLATNLRRSGVKVELDEQKGSARVTAIPDHVRDAFSKRTRDAHETARQYAKENGIDWDSLTPEDKIKHVKGSAKGNRQAKQFSDVEAWHKQAEALGWRHTTVIDQNKRVEPMAHENRIVQAHTASLRFVEADFTRHAVISAFDIRTSAARGLIASGIESDEDINSVTKLMRDVGVRQNGKQTDLMWGKAFTVKGIEQVHITTRLHVRQEEELIDIARKGAADKSKALDVREINDAAQRRGLDFSNDHGEAQRRMMEQLGTGGQVAVAVGAAGSGKAQPDTSLVLTPNGFVPIGSLTIGDMVMTPYGKSVPVIGIFPQGEKEIFAVRFSDGRTVECCENHLWKIWNFKNVYVPSTATEKWKKIFTREWSIEPLHKIRKWLAAERKSKPDISIPLVDGISIDLPSVELPIPAYALGALLGDGSIRVYRKSLSVMLCDPDKTVLKRVLEELPDYEVGGAYGKGGYSYRLRMKVKTCPSRMWTALKDLGLLGAGSYEKFIPEIYKKGNSEQRVSLLQGLLDTDGCVSSRNGTSATFSSVSKKLACDVQEVAWSLGAVARLYEVESTTGYSNGKTTLRYQVCIKHHDISQFFHMPRKVARCNKKSFAHRLRIESIEPIGTKPARCIAIDSPDHLYVTNNYIVTHNTAVLGPLVDIWKKHGMNVYGAALAWRQSDDLAATGIEQDNRAALAAFLSRAKRGTIKLDEKSVVVVDELGLIGTRQALDLLRLQRDHGFKLVAVGDERQCQAIEAGPVIELMRRALGKEAVPEILTTIRQKTEREREISGLFRDGKAGMALGMKREDGTVQLVPGGYREAVERVADLWQERRDANAHDPNFTISISAPSNADAREISAVLRARRQSKGEVSRDQFIISATDQHGAKYDLPLAVGDRVRLFDRVAASFGERGGIIGNNGSVLEIRKLDKDGIVLQTTTGLTGRVKWEALKDSNNERIRLSYGDVGTIDSLQGITSTEHIDALPAGSKSVQGFKAYVAESRHRQKSWMVTSDGAERQEIVDRRALGDPRPIRDEDIWENMARNLSRQPEKMAAMDFLDAAERFRNRATVSMQEGFQRSEQRDVDGLEPASLRHTVTREAEVEQVSKAVFGIADVSEQRQKTLDTFEDRLHAFDAAMASVEKHIEDISTEHLLQAMGATPQAELPDAPDWADGKEQTPAPMPNRKHLRTPGRRKQEQIPKEHLEALKETVRISDLISQSVKLERAGHDFKACCPFHDERTPSFHVSDKKGTFTCYGCGEHGDALDWLNAQHGLKFHDAIKYLEDRSGITLPNAINVPRVTAQKESEWKAVPVPPDAPPLIQPSGKTARIYNPKREGTDKEWGTYRPAHVASYQDSDGKQLGYVIRVEIKDETAHKDRKFTPQVTWVVPADTPADADPAKVGRWALHPMPDPRPLYHAEMLVKHPDVPVIVVAGEKKADALQAVMGNDAVVVSWAGGDNARQLVDFKPLADRDVIVWPDADQSGIDAALGKIDKGGRVREGAAKMIDDVGAAKVRVLMPPDESPKGWDCGDFVKEGATKADVRKLITERAKDRLELERGRHVEQEDNSIGL